jgi:ribosomal protein S3AE
MAIEKRKKKFFDVEMPLIGKETQMQAYEISELNGRFMRYDLTRALRGKSIMLTLKVKVEDNKATTIPKKIELLPFFIRRMIRKGTNYVEDSFDAECKDAKLRIKPLLVTRRKVSRAIRKELRNKMKEESIAYVKDKESEKLFDEVLKAQMQKVLSLRLKKIYPLALCEIRILESKMKE